jgi:hypothetical protein
VANKEEFSPNWLDFFCYVLAMKIAVSINN